MPSRQDQLHSYQYSLQRVVAALVTHDPDPHRSPLRRAGTTALVSLLIAAVAVGAVAVYGVLTGSGSAEPTSDSAVYVEKGTGARFVLGEGKLHPVLNFSSALLLAGGQSPEVISTSTEQLAKVPLGATLGIPDAPDSLPGKDSLLTAAWSVCTRFATGDAEPLSTLVVGEGLSGGTSLTGTDKALLVRDPQNETFLVYGSRRFLIPADRLQATLSTLGMNGQQPWPVATAWLNALRLGPDLRPPAIPDFGRPSSVGNLPVGQLISDKSLGATQTQFSVVLADGVSPVTRMQAQLLLTVSGARTPVPTGDFAQLGFSSTTVSDSGAANPMPADVPALATIPSGACVTRPIGTGKDDVLIDPVIPAGTTVSGATVPGGVQADLVHVARGKGAVVSSVTSPSATSGTITLVTDTGLRYSVASPDAAAKLGYGDVEMPRVPAELVALLPQGPALDPAKARQTQPNGQ